MCLETAVPTPVGALFCDCLYRVAMRSMSVVDVCTLLHRIDQSRLSCCSTHERGLIRS